MDEEAPDQYPGSQAQPSSDAAMLTRARPIDPASWLWLAAAVLLALALRIPFFRIPMLADEGGYAWATRGWIEGTGHLYGDLWISRPQGIFIVYAGILEALGTNTIAMRFAAWIAIAATIVAVWGFARLCASPFAANLAALIFAVTSSLPNLEGYSANAEVFMGLPAAFAALWLLRVRRTGWSFWQLFGVGVLIGVSTSLKPSGLVMLPVALIFIWLIGDGASHLVRWRRTWPILAGVGFIGLASLAHGWLLGWDDFYYATILYRLSAQSAATVGLMHNLESIWRLAVRAQTLVVLCGLVLVLHHRQTIVVTLKDSIHSPGRLPRVIGSRLTQSLRTMRKPRNDGRFLLRLWILGALLGAAIGGDWWAHYLIQVVAPMSIWLGWSIALTLPSLRRRGRWFYGISITVLLVVPFWVLIHGSPTDMARAMFSHPGYAAQDKVAAYLRDHSEPSDTIYVAFDQASIYYIADRPPAYRHLYDQELRGIPESYAEIISIIRGPDRPKFIVSTRQPGPFADESRAFWQEVGLYYEVVEIIDDVPIYQDKSTIGT